MSTRPIFSNDIYDLYLVDIGGNEVQLIIFMKILFTFVDGKNTDGTAVKWTEDETKKFVATWRGQVAGVDRQALRQVRRTSYVLIHVAFDIRVGNSFARSHWQMLIEKLPASSTGKTSFVWRDQIGKKYDVQLDSQDNDLKTGLADGTQTGSIHEFGHMLGLGDEYTADAAKALRDDKKSIMNGGSSVPARATTRACCNGQAKSWPKSTRRSRRTGRSRSCGTKTHDGGPSAQYLG